MTASTAMSTPQKATRISWLELLWSGSAILKSATYRLIQLLIASHPPNQNPRQASKCHTNNPSCQPLLPLQPELPFCCCCLDGYRQMQRESGKRRGRYSIYMAVLAYVKLRRWSRRSRHRRYVLTEWLTTERDYLKDLKLALQHIKMPLLQQKIIDLQEAQTLCPSFESMVMLSEEMISVVQVVESEKNMTKIVIGPNLIKFASFYKLTSEYFGCRLKSERLMQRLFEEHKGQMQAIQARFKQAAKGVNPKRENMTMGDCLQQPQYRMFKYGLLLKDYKKKMPRWHSDYAAIQQAERTFEEINISNNDKMVKLELAEKKIKLNELAGRALDNQSEFRAEMEADSLYFPVRLYIFNNLVVISKLERILSFQQERKYLTVVLNEFSYVRQKPDGKYYKNGLVLCGQYEAIHLFTSEPGSRFEIVKTLEKVINNLQAASVARRQKVKAPTDNAKLSFVLSIGKQATFAPELRAEVLHIEVRPLGKFSNDTVYLTRFSAPVWNEDCEVAGTALEKVHIGVWQLVEVHLSKVMELFDSLSQQYPSIEFPKVDPVTKEMNAYTEGKKKTIMFEQRGFLFEEFFNFILRNPTVMRSPMEIVHRHKIIAPFWDYLVKKNEYLLGRNADQKKETSYAYGPAHCALCDEVLKAPLVRLEGIREEFKTGRRNDFCFNAACLLRLKILGMPKESFDSLERCLLRECEEAGRVDYAMFDRDELHKRYQQVEVRTMGDSQKQMVVIDYRRKVGQVILDIALFLGIGDGYDCRLLLRYQDKERILDQDEVLFELIDKYRFPAVEKEDAARESRFSYNVTTIQKEEGLFAMISEVFASRVESSLCFRKVLFLPKELEIASAMRNPRKGRYLVAELFARLAKGQIPLEPDDWAEAAAMWLLLEHFGHLKGSPVTHLIALIADRLTPDRVRGMVTDKVFLRVLGDCIDRHKRMDRPPSQKQLPNLYRNVIRIFYRSVHTYTYLAPFTIYSLPDQAITDGKGSMEEQCCLGVNFKEFLVFRTRLDRQPALKVPLGDLRVTSSTFSLFLQHSPEIGGGSGGCEGARTTKMRFDGRLLYHFRYMIDLYANLRRIFPNHIL